MNDSSHNGEESMSFFMTGVDVIEEQFDIERQDSSKITTPAGRTGYKSRFLRVSEEQPSKIQLADHLAINRKMPSKTQIGFDRDTSLSLEKSGPNLKSKSSKINFFSKEAIERRQKLAV